MDFYCLDTVTPLPGVIDPDKNIAYGIVSKVEADFFEPDNASKTHCEVEWYSPDGEFVERSKVKSMMIFLKSRGPTWAEEFGQTYSFHSAQDQAEYEIFRGRTVDLTEIRANGSLSERSALDIISSGGADILMFSGYARTSGFSLEKRERFYVYRLENRAIGEEVRSETLANHKYIAIMNHKQVQMDMSFA